MIAEKNILIVGASSSIGGAITSRFRAPSTRIIATYFPEIKIMHDEFFHPLVLDLDNDISIEKFTKEVFSFCPHIDTAIFLAGTLPGSSLKDYNFANIDKVMKINFTGQAKVIKGLLPLLDSNSQIIMISSISAQKGSYDPLYSASKGAILSFVKSLAIGLNGVRVNAIAPGLIENSTMYNDMSVERRELHKSQTSNKQLLSIVDLSNIIFDISQDHWKHLNGACIDINSAQYVR